MKSYALHYMLKIAEPDLVPAMLSMLFNEIHHSHLIHCHLLYNPSNNEREEARHLPHVRYFACMSSNHASLSFKRNDGVHLLY